MNSLIKRNMCGLAHWLFKGGPELHEGITSVVRDCLSGPWRNANPSDLHIKKLRGGLSNSVFQVTLNVNQSSLENHPKSIIMRFHDKSNFDSIFKHVAESVTFMFLSEKRFGPKLYAIFPGGRIEEYMDSRALTTKELALPKFSLAIAEKMAVLHSLNPPLSRKKGLMFDLMETWLKQIKTENFCWKTDNLNTEKCVHFIRKLDLSSEITWIRNFLKNTDSPIICCHNDIHEGNLLLQFCPDTDKRPKITLIDYEYCFYNYQAFEFANHFLEHTINYEMEDYPNFVVNENDYPSQQQQLLFIRRYLAIKKFLGTDGSMGKAEIPLDTLDDVVPQNSEAGVGEITNEEYSLLDQITKFQLASHLLWGIWGTLRTQSCNTFCYWEYSYARLKAYYKLKEKLKN